MQWKVSSVSISSDSAVLDEPELLFHMQVGGILHMYVEGSVLARIALSCKFALDSLNDKAEEKDPGILLTPYFGTIDLGGSLSNMGTISSWFIFGRFAYFTCSLVVTTKRVQRSS